MHGGRLQQYGTPHEVYAQPANRMVADFMGLVNLVPGEVRAVRTAAARSRSPASSRSTIAAARRHSRPATRVEVAIRPENITPRRPRGRAAGGSAAEDHRTHVFLGNISEYYATLPSGQTLRVQTHPLQRLRGRRRGRGRDRRRAMQRVPPRSVKLSTTTNVRSLRMNKPVSPAAVIRGEEHWTNKGDDVRLFLWEKYAGDPSGPSAAPSCSCTARRWPRSRPSTCRCRAAPIPRRWIGSPRAASTPGASTWRATAAPPRRATTTRRSRNGADDCFAGRELYPEAARQAAAAGLRHFVGRVARGAVRAAPSRTGRAARARRHGVDRRGPPDARRAQQAAARIPSQEPPADRPRLRALDLHPRPSRHRRRQRDRGVRRRDPRARRFGADRHLCRHVRQPAGGAIPTKIKAPTIIMRGQ